MKTIIRLIVSLGLLITFCLMAFAESRPVTVMLDWKPNPDHAPLVIAEKLGYFKNKGITVKLLTPSSPHAVTEWTKKGKVDIGITDEPEFVREMEKGAPLVRIGTLIDYPLGGLFTLKKSGIQTIENLKGKRIAIPLARKADPILLAILKKGGLKEQDVKIINGEANLTQALLSGKVDAIIGMRRNLEIAELNAKNQEFNTFFPEDHGVPSYDQLIFMTNANKINDQRIPKFMEAIREAVHYIDLHPREAWDHFISIYPESNHAVHRQAFFNTLPYFAEEPTEFNTIKTERLAKFIRKNELIQSDKV